ncbi:MAG: PilZ domain-containing protein [Chloroflexi bacterium]|nr:PilZ domain-containing protein [Chloroflexota bacterium]
MEFQERRAAARVPAHLPIKYFYRPANGAATTTYTVDLSETGARVEALDELPLGAAIAFLVIADSNQVMDVRGQIMRVEPTPEPRAPAPYRIGVRFTQISETDRTLLTQVLERLKKN